MRNLLPGVHFGGRRVVKGGTGERLRVLATHWPSVPGYGAGPLPELVLGLASGECVDVAQPSTGLREGKVGDEAEAGIDGRERCGRNDIADDEEDVDGKSE